LAVLTWILLIALIVGAAAFISLPLRRRRLGARRDEERTHANTEKEAALQLIRDLDQDRQTGKLEADEYAEQRAAAEAAAIRAMKRLESFGEAPGTDSLEQLIRLERTRLEKEARG
jgi:cytochrome c-type biogenesis protein CcmI